jgi:uncharacterized protein YvpB
MHRGFNLITLIALALIGCGQQPTSSRPTPVQLPTLENQVTLTPPLDPSPTPTVPPTLTPTVTARSRTATPSAAAATGTPTRLALPTSGSVKGMYGYGQLLPLSCEARSAADWARHFGITIRELEFMARMPRSKNPEAGFVGSPNGGWGLVPPDSYGVHAGPVASVLKGYGARAKAVRNLSFEQLQAEIAAGRPVIVWVTGHVAPGKSVDYKIDGKTITVAPYEHTVIVTGYDEKRVTILDGKQVYQRTIDTFLQSWKALENMAILWDEEASYD